MSFKGSPKRERFFNESLKLFHEKGFKATTLRDIADKLDCEVPNIYNYIKSKQSFLEVCLFEVSADFHKGIDEIIQSSYTANEKILEVIRLHVRFSAQRPYEMSLHVNAWRNLKEPQLGKFLSERKAYEQKIQLIIKEGMKKGLFQKMELEVSTNLLLASVRWLYNYYVGGESKINALDMEKQISDFVLRGFLKKDSL